MKRVFLGGTCNESNWRAEMEAHLDSRGIGYFNPVVEDWTDECKANELRERSECDICLYTITPKMAGVYSIAEVIDDSNKRPEKTIMVCLDTDDGISFAAGQLKSIRSVLAMVSRNGGKVFWNLLDAANYMETSD